MPPEDFVKDVLVGQLSVSTVIVGKNFTYGHKAAGNVDSLVAAGLKFNFTVDVQELKSEESDIVSSSRIRKLVIEGSVEEARTLLSRPHRLDGVVVHGEKRGRETVGHNRQRRHLHALPTLPIRHSDAVDLRKEILDFADAVGIGRHLKLRFRKEKTRAAENGAGLRTGAVALAGDYWLARMK
jgi:hypothetical protein